MAVLWLLCPRASPGQERVTPDVFYMPTPRGVVAHGARGVGIDIDPALVLEAQQNADLAGVADKVRFVRADLFTADISEATVVTLFLTPSLNIKLRPKLNRDLRPGTRVVSHRWEMKEPGGREYLPEKKLLVDGSAIYFWRIPIQ